jgi:hypothetical protein
MANLEEHPMSSWQAALSTEQRSLGSDEARAPLDLRLIIGLAILCLGAALFGVGLFHGFSNGSCSTTGYTAHYGPVPHCGKGIGWWVMIVTLAVFVAAGGAMLSRTANTVLVPIMFMALGAPFLALGLRPTQAHLVLGTSAATGRLETGIFGACFLIAGLIWGAFAGMRAFASWAPGSRFGAVLAGIAGVAIAFVIGAGVAGAVGPMTPPASQQASPVISPATSEATSAATTAAARRANAAIAQANVAAEKAAKLAACVSAAGTHVARIQRCEAKYTP